MSEPIDRVVNRGASMNVEFSMVPWETRIAVQPVAGLPAVQYRINSDGSFAGFTNRDAWDGSRLQVSEWVRHGNVRTPTLTFIGDNGERVHLPLAENFNNAIRAAGLSGSLASRTSLDLENNRVPEGRDVAYVHGERFAVQDNNANDPQPMQLRQFHPGHGGQGR